jgi:hypothetical protein
MKHFEFWHPRVFETPYYGYLLGRCALKGLSPHDIPKANYALDHGEIGLGSKYSTQMAFDQARFPATACLNLPQDLKAVSLFAQAHSYPFILKPLIGTVGKGVVKVSSSIGLQTAIQDLQGAYLVQSYCPDPDEYGVFYTRKNGKSQITGINQKHFPSVTGDGSSSLATLVSIHPRHTEHWDIFLRYLDLSKIPDAGEIVILSFIGSHTLGCKFTDDSNIKTTALEEAVFTVCDSQPGFNFGRFDLKTPSREAFLDGEFTIIEVNGISSLPTHMFDPDNSIRRGYQIFFEHGRHLIDIAHEHRHREMDIDSYLTLLKRAKSNLSELNTMHDVAKQRPAPNAELEPAR